jgi:hypothetical protein
MKECNNREWLVDVAEMLWEGFSLLCAVLEVVSSCRFDDKLSNVK